MANIKITDLTAYTNPDATDVLPIVDVGAGITKQISIENLLKNASSGTAAAPGIAFDGDSNTGIYRPGADQVAISTNGSERLRITSDGKVGLGTSAPSSPLHIANNSAGTADAIELSNFTGTSSYIKSARGLTFSADFDANSGDSESYISFETDATEHARITSDGKVGVGTTSPGSALEVRSDGSGLAQILRVTRHNGEDAGVFRIDVDPDANEIHYCATGSQGGAHVWTQGSAASEKARLDSSGRLLVGTSSSTSFIDSNSQTQNPLFEINTSSNTNSSILLKYDSGSASASRRATFAFYRTADGTTVSNDSCLGEYLWLGEGGADNPVKAASIGAFVDGTPGTDDMPGRLVFSVTADGASSPTEAMRIKNSRILNFANTPVYADNAAAKAGGLVDGDVYRKSDGTLMIVYT